jgi:hypothetical protein
MVFTVEATPIGSPKSTSPPSLSGSSSTGEPSRIATGGIVTSSSRVRRA